MRAIYFSAINSVQLIDAPEPMIMNPTDVKVKISFTGICGSEILGLQGGHPTRKPPIISGHEASGIVTEIGHKVERIKVGDRIAIDPQYGCGVCSDCLEGNYNVCYQKKVLGTTGWQGSFGEYVILPQQTVCRLPDAISLEYGALLEPLSVGFHAVNISRLSKGKTALVIGCGPIGISIVMACKCAEADKIICVDIKDYNLDVALKAGGTQVLKSSNDLINQVMNLTSGMGVDVVYVAVGGNRIVNQALDCVRRKGEVVILAHFHDEMSIDVKKLRWKEANMIGTFMFVRQEFEDVIKLIENGSIDPGIMITEIVPVEQGVETINALSNKRMDVVKVIMSFSPTNNKSCWH